MCSSQFEWLANITNAKTRRANRIDVFEFFAFAGLQSSAELRGVTRAHVTGELDGAAAADPSGI